MNEQVKKKWIAALRSDDYSQGTGRLLNRDKTRHCCLGVLCDLAVKEGVTPEPVRSWVLNEWAFGEEQSAWAELPSEVVSWAALDSANPKIKTMDYISLSGLNDGAWNGKRFSFSQIADLIEAEL